MRYAPYRRTAGLSIAVLGLLAATAHADDQPTKPFNAAEAARLVAQNDPTTAPGDQPDHYQQVTTTRNTPMILSGLVTFGIAYGVSASVAAATDSEANNRLYVPLAGPWLSLADRPSCPVEDSSCDNETTKKVLLVVDGVVQGASVVTFFYGLLNPIESTSVAGTEVSNLRLSPTLMGDGRGLVLAGEF